MLTSVSHSLVLLQYLVHEVQFHSYEQHTATVITTLPSPLLKPFFHGAALHANRRPDANTNIATHNYPWLLFLRPSLSFDLFLSPLFSFRIAGVMEAKLAAAGKEILVEIVKLVQKCGMRGDKGGWKEFLNLYDEKFGASLSDPARRSPDVLHAFLRTFKEESDLEFFSKVIKCHANRETAKQLLNSQDIESSEQRLVRLTFEHPQYPIEYSFPSHEEDWIVTDPGKKPKKRRSSLMIAVDCEMVLCEDGTDALVKICVVDRDLQVKLHEFVRPNKAIVDYRTHITGVSARDLDGVSCSLKDVQKSMKKLLSHGTILVGHGLSNDLRALKIDHARVVDTSFIFKYGDESMKRRPSLCDLCKSVLGYEVRKKGDPHNCLDDASAAMKLVLAKLDNQYDGILPLVKEDVLKEEMAKLLVHRIPISLPSEELHKIIPGDFTIEIQTNKKGRGEKYSVLAVFKNPEEALQAFDDVKGDEEEDSYGRLQKSVPIQLDSSLAAAICIRKMARDNPHPDRAPAKKRQRANEISGADPKTEEPEKNLCADHLEEINRLKKLLSQRDEEISNLHKIIAALTRKQGL
ncbi:hypothetical protein Nepgr_016653 [Nepenthes gracilis]|uniref:Exonuclease domain-containing protein n=1 Tax=Nepenthes gracilis TaxID=150966 RepID=A0AAD3SPP4_NEPGR|nr:hypothetical protein Nepgr_016653 [Nepenthes gracilis]